MTNTTQPAVEVDADVEPAVVLTNKTLKLLDEQFPESEGMDMPDDAFESVDPESK